MANDNSDSTMGGGNDGCCDKERLSQLMDGDWAGIDLGRSVVGVCGDKVLRDKWARYHLVRDAMRHEPVDATNELAARICAAVSMEAAYTNVTTLAGSGLAGNGSADSDEDAAEPSSAVQSSADQAGADQRGADQRGADQMGADQRGADQRGVDQMDDDLTDVATRSASSRPIRTLAAGFGLAASVALVTVVGLDAWQDASDNEYLTAGIAGERVGDDAALPTTPVIGQQVAGAPLPVVQFVSDSGAYWTAPESTERRTASEDRLNMFLSQHIENSPTAERQGMLPYSRLVGYDERGLQR